MNESVKRIFDTDGSDFTELALEVFAYQYKESTIYRNFVDRLKRPKPRTLEEIPFLPVSFFKSHDIISEGKTAEMLFLSSGTTDSVRSRHLVADLRMYEKSALATYEKFAGKLQDQVILALLPNYLEQGNSSLVYMIDYFIKKTQHELSGFYKDDFGSLLENYRKACLSGKKLVIFGVSYALLDLAELKPDLSQALIIETGGMKGRREELTKSELHQRLKTAFQVEFISSEYGMTELLSQAYSNRNEYFELPPWMKILLRDPNDPFSYVGEHKTGGINVIDLANLYSCSFIATQDLGQLTENGLKLMGRFDNSDLRGCNLMVE